MIISWLLFIVAVAIWWAIHYHFQQLGYVTDEDWFESGLSFSVWGYIELICVFIGLFSPFVALISTAVYIVQRLKKECLFKASRHFPMSTEPTVSTVSCYFLF